MRLLAILLIGCMMATAAAAAPAVRTRQHTVDTGKPIPFFLQTGRASWYGDWHDGKATASGTQFDPDEFTAAHPWLPFGTVVRVTNLRNRRMVKVRVTDRGPRAKSRVIDISAAAAREIGMWRRGVARVSVKAFHEDQDAARPSRP
jgi:rare lipoprotein A